MAAKKKYLMKKMVIDGQSKTPWYVDDITKEIKRLAKCRDEIGNAIINGEEHIEIYPRINEYGNLMWHFQVYRWEYPTQKIGKEIVGK